jgi:hypothetical protein
LELNVQIFANEVKEGLEIGVAGVLGELFAESWMLLRKESTYSEDIESSSRSGKRAPNLAKSEP